MKWLFLILALCGFSSLGFGATINAASCSQSDVQTAVTSASSGDTVMVPSGSCSWSSAVVVPNTKGITIQCASGTCTIGQGTSSGYIQVNQHASTTTRVTGFTFTGAGSSSNCDVAVIGSPSSAAARIDHNIFTNASGSEFICTSGNAPALIDHNTLTGGAASEMIHNLGLGASDASGWTNDVTPGSSGMVFIEDNTFTFNAVTAFFGTSAVQSYYGARTVFRHNTLNNAQIDQHGTAGNIGARWWEVYNNIFCTYPGINQSNYGDLRAGSGVFFNNTAPTTAPCGTRSGGGFVTLHEEDSGYPALYQIGRGISQNLSPAYLWNNAAAITINSGSGNVLANRDYFVSGSQPSNLVRWELSADNGSTTYSYTPYTYPHPLQAVVTTYFVANAGSDAAAGTSSGAAWKTIAKINGFSFASGDTVSFNRGDSWNLATDAALVAKSGVTYNAYGTGALPILDGQGTVAQGFTASSKSNVVVDSLNIKRNTSYNALFASCDTCSITNSTLADAGVHGVDVTSVSPTFTATGNTYSTSAGFHMTGKAFNIASTSASASTISSNTIDLSQVLNTDNVSGIVCSASIIGCIATNNAITMAQGTQGIGIKSASASGHTTGGQITGNSITGLTSSCTGCDGEGIELTGDATNQVKTTLVSGNYIKLGSAATDCMGLFHAVSNVVSYNFCLGNSGTNAGIHPSSNSDANLFYGNDLYLPSATYGFEVTGTSINDVFQNNIVVGSGYGFIFSSGGTGTFSYNIAFSNATANFSGGTNSGHNLTSDPKFVTSPPTTSNDFKLLSGSPAINAGANLGATYQLINNSIDTVFPYSLVNQNSFGTGWEMGAFQFAPSVNLSPSSLSFADQTSGTSSSPTVVTLTNDGTVTLNISSNTLTTAQYSKTTTCGATVAPAASCTFSITFSPTTIGLKSDTLTIADDAGIQTIAISGTGTTTSPVSTATPVISSIAVSSITYNTAVVTWTTDVGSDSLGGFGRSDFYGQDVGENDTVTPVTSHTQTLTGLWASNQYYYLVRSRGFTNGVPDPAKTAVKAAAATFTAAAASAGTYTIAARIEAPAHVVQGHEVYALVPTHTQIGSDAAVTYVVSGLPPSVTLHFPDQEAGLGGTFNSGTSTATTTSPIPTQAEIVTSGSTTPGTYAVNFHITSGTATAIDIPWSLTVDAVPTFPSGTPSTYPAIPSKSLWETHMLTYGAQWCAQDTTSPRTIRPNSTPSCGIGAYNCAQYYDGESIFFKVIDYTGNNTYLQCAQNVEAFYRDSYVLPLAGAVQAIEVFPEGLYQDYLRTGDVVSKNAIHLLATVPGFSAMSGGALISPQLNREGVYKLTVNRLDVKLGQSGQQVYVDRAVALSLGYIDQWTSGAYPIQPFMAGLCMEALIRYYEDGHQSDNRIPTAVKALVDWLWANAWFPPDGSETQGTGTFYYNSWRNFRFIDSVNQGAAPGTSEIRDLNLLIAPAFAWVFKMTGDATYQVNGDVIWDQGVRHAQIATQYGKQFSESYRWSFDYVTWRSAPVIAPPTGLGVQVSGGTKILPGTVLH